jgi:hypothetical protein
VGVAGTAAIWSSARVICAAASTSAECSSDRCPAFAPQARGLLDQPSFGAVTCQKLRLVLGNFGELALEGLCDAGVERASRLAQQHSVSRVLHQRVLKQIGRMWRNSLLEEQTSSNKAIQCGC